MYHHTEHDLRVRRVNVSAIDFGALKGGIVTCPLDAKKAQDFEELNPLAAK